MIKLSQYSRTRRCHAWVMIIIFMATVFLPDYAWALTTGPHQPEFTSYEEPGATDLVNLLTGDLHYSIPLMEIPGPEGGFSLPLSYSAGIGTEQEASWVGLGWSLNAGAITREINVYPDDASGETNLITMVDLNGVRGWVSNGGLWQTGWNTVQGSFGSINLYFTTLNYSFNHGSSFVGVAGLSFGSNGVGINPLEFGLTLLGISGPPAATAIEKAAKMEEVAVNMAYNMASGSALSEASVPKLTNSPGFFSANHQIVKQGFLHKDFWMWLDKTRSERMYGLMNLDQAPAPATLATRMQSLNNGPVKAAKLFDVGDNNSGSASDISYYIPSGMTFRTATSPALSGADNFSVKASGVSGSIRPYRFEVGSVSMPREMTSDHQRFSIVPHKSYKVPFLYEGSNSNSYLWHTGSNNTSFVYGLDMGTQMDSTGTISQSIYKVNDPSVGQLRSDMAPNYKLAQGNHVEWLSNDEIANSTDAFSNKFMDYFSATSNPTRANFRRNYQFTGSQLFITSSNTFPFDGYLNLKPAEIGYLQVNGSVTLEVFMFNTLADMKARLNPTNLGILPASVLSVDPQLGKVKFTVPSQLTSLGGKYLDIRIRLQSMQKNPGGIGGYAITNANGVTYHFSLPVYEYGQKTWIGDKVDSAHKYSKIERAAPFANTWLLTGITGSDFVDRNLNGIIDESDWGFWIRLNYSQYRSDYTWRSPFTGTSLDRENTSFSYSTGKKELFYLNSIETRSHVAIFMKDYRLDNKGADQVANSSLRLAEIALMSRDKYKALKSTFGQNEDSGTINSWWNFSSFFSGGTPTAMGSFLLQNCIKRIRFTHTYDLCPGTPNSVAPGAGKLSLTRVSVFGSNSALLVPDYKFEYGQDPSFAANYANNPPYNPNAWDGWGSYNSSGSSSPDSHYPSTNLSDGLAWSLTRVVTPLGSTIDIVYERDTYASVSGVPMSAPIPYTRSNYDVPYYGPSSFNEIYLNNTSGQIKAGDIVRITNGNALYYCPGANTITYPATGSIDLTVANAAPDRITLNGSFMNIACTPAYGSNIHFDYNSGVVTVMKTTRIGGDLRVGSITLNDQTTTQKTRYLYVGNDGFTSGVVSQEPVFSRKTTYDFAANKPGYPVTPVMYSKVTILNGKLTQDTDFTTRTVYEFETPDINMMTYNTVATPVSWQPLAKLIKNEITDNTSKIGALKSLRIYDQSGNLTKETLTAYVSQVANIDNVARNQGNYSEGSLMHDLVIERDQLGNPIEYHKMTRSTVVKVPYVLQTTFTTKDGMTSVDQNMAWDFVSGQVVDKMQISALGIRLRTIITPAYSVPSFAGLGPKALNLSNVNNLLAPASTYVYKVDPVTSNPVGLISGTASVWSNSWTNYRVLSGSTYLDGSDSPGFPVWRKSKDFTYVGTYAELQADGTMNFNASKQFDITKVNGNPGWLQVGQVLRYDHFSAPLESKGLDSIRTSIKRDINSLNILAQGANTSYQEMAYSGAEDGAGSSLFFGGEVAKGAATIISNGTPGSTTHTGSGAVQLSVGAKSFTYKPASLKPGKTYRASVWTNSLNGAIYYILNGTGEQTILPVSTNVVGSWYQINVEIPMSTFTSFEIGVKSTSGTVNFDDFRFQPRDSQVTGTVYDANTGSPTFVLDNDNMYTQYVYDNAGQLIKTYQESFKYGVKLVSEKRYNYRRFNTNP